MTQLGNIVYVVCEKSSVIKTYTADTLKALGIRVQGMRNPVDIAACHYDRLLYVADWDYCLWRVSTDDHSYVKWLPIDTATDTFRISSVSLRSARLLVTSLWSSTLRHFSTRDRQLLRVIDLSHYVKELYHATETSRGTFVVGYRGLQAAVSECL